MPRREKLSAVDTAWLRMDRPGNPMMICAVLLFRGRLRLDRLRAIVSERFLRFPRFRQHPVIDANAAYWEEDDEFAIERHVMSIDVPAPGGQPQLQALVSRLAGTVLDPLKPLWEFHLVPRYGPGSAVIMRIHHCYADGIALVQVMLSMTDPSPDARVPAAPHPPRRIPREERSDESLTAPIASALRVASKATSVLLERGAALWMNPGKAVELAQQSGAVTREIARLAMMGEDSRTRFKGHPRGKKRVAWTAPLALEDVKAIGKALDASVNDVLLSCVAGAMGSYLAAHGDRRDGVMIRALVPVNLRPAGQADRLGNHFGLVFLDLPIGIRNPIERLYAVRANMRALKGSYQPALALGLLAAMGSGPKMLQDQLLWALARNASAVVTNVPGPQQRLYLAGAEIESLMFWVPQSGDIGVGASIISFNGEVQFGLITDRVMCEDPERIARGFAHAFDELLFAALLTPWPADGDLDPDAVEEAVTALAGGARHRAR